MRRYYTASTHDVDAQPLINAFKCKVSRCLCLPECVVSYNAPSSPMSLPSSCGVILPNSSIRLIDNNNKDVKEGPLYVKGPQICSGYVTGVMNKTKDGYFKCDVNAKLDDAGRLFIVQPSATPAAGIATTAAVAAVVVTKGMYDASRCHDQHHPAHSKTHQTFQRQVPMTVLRSY